MNKFGLLISIVLTFSATVDAKNKDKKGSKDHPLIGRYDNTFILDYQYSDYDEYPLIQNKQVKKEPTPVKVLEGEVTTIIYKTNATDQSILKVYRNFENAFSKLGFKKLFACKGKDGCGRRLPRDAFIENGRQGRYDKAEPHKWGSSYGYRLWNGVLNQEGKDIFVNLVVMKHNNNNKPVKILLDVVETKEMEADLVTLNPSLIDEKITSEGKVVLTGLFFETNDDQLKPSSTDSLNAISSYLNQHPKSKVYIVGHTDNQGEFTYNRDLSQRRAESVIATLVKQHGIDKSRLMPLGMADASPVSSNDNEAGRSLNRRVEMVLR